MRPLLLLGHRTSGIGIWSGAGSVHQMDISSNTQKVHGRILWANPVTISHVLGVPHYYWGVGRPEWVSGTTPTTAPCSPSGWQCYLYVGYRTTLAQSPNQCQMDWWLNDTFLLSRKQIDCERSIFLSIQIMQLIQSKSWAQSHKLHQSGLHIYGFILRIPIT